MPSARERPRQSTPARCAQQLALAAALAALPSGCIGPCSPPPVPEDAAATPSGPAAARVLTDLAGAADFSIFGDVVCAMVGAALRCIDASAPSEGLIIAPLDAGRAVPFDIEVGAPVLAHHGGAVALAIRSEKGPSWWHPGYGGLSAERRLAGQTLTWFGGSHVSGCVLLEEGTVQCWGFVSTSEQQATRDAPAQVAGLPPVREVALGGSSFACAVTRAGAVFCWGSNYDSHLPISIDEQRTLCAGLDAAAPAPDAADTRPSDCPASDFVRVPFEVAQVHDAKRVTCGEHHCCALDGQGAVYCWGRSEHGQAARAQFERPETVVHLEDLGTGVLDVAAGRRSTCALMPGGSVRCWGLISDGTDRQRRVDRGLASFEVRGVSPATKLVLGSRIGCGMTAEGIVCWGSGGPVAP